VVTAWEKAGRLSDWERPSFDGREISLGERAGDWYVVRQGLEEGQEVVASGAFKIDSALQIQAKPSMMSMVSLDVPDEFRRSLGALYTSYFQLHEALGNDQRGNRLPEATRAWDGMAAALRSVSVEWLDERAAAEWELIRQPLQERLAAGLEGKSIDAAREVFQPVAAAMLELVETFGHDQPTTLYHVYCSMAFGNKGAGWLQAGRQIANPYFGYKKMISCSQIKRSFAPQTAAAAPPDPEQEEAP
jgi:Cu(I)/Ag(I) efflux system membrane fusion protein